MVLLSTDAVRGLEVHGGLDAARFDSLGEEIGQAVGVPALLGAVLVPAVDGAGAVVGAFGAVERPALAGLCDVQGAGACDIVAGCGSVVIVERCALGDGSGAEVVEAAAVGDHGAVAHDDAGAEGHGAVIADGGGVVVSYGEGRAGGNFERGRSFCDIYRAAGVRALRGLGLAVAADFNGGVGADTDLAGVDVHGAQAVVVDLCVDAALEGHLAGAGDGVAGVAAEVHDAAVKDEVGAVGGVAAAVGDLYGAADAVNLEDSGEAGAVSVEYDSGAAADVDAVFSAAAVPLDGVLRVVLDGHGRACDVDGVVAGAVDGVNVALNTAAVQSHGCAAEVQTGAAAESDGHPAKLGIAGCADAGHNDGTAVKGERRAVERDALTGKGDAVIALDGDAL